MADEKEKDEFVKPVTRKEQSFTLLKDFKTSEKEFKKGEQYSHSSKKVIEYLKTNKYI